MFQEILCALGFAIDVILEWSFKHPVLALTGVIIVLILFIFTLMSIYRRPRKEVW